MSDPAGPVQFSLGDLGGPFGKFSDHSERWTKRTTKTAWSSPEARAGYLRLQGHLDRQTKHTDTACIIGNSR